MFNAIEVASLFGTLELRDTATQTLRQFDSSLDRTAQNLQNIGGRLQGLGLAISAAVAPLVGFGAQGVRTAMTFDSAMAQISARTGTVGEDLERVRQLALQMGADTVFSAQDAADAMLELLASGQTVEQMMSTLPSVLTAAAASGEDLGTTADNITNILASFRLGVEDAGSVVDALSRAAGASSADMASLGQGFANVGGVAAQFGLSVEQTAAILAIFAENGIKGSEAGTQLRSMLLNMSRDTDTVRDAWAAFGSSMYDAQGNLRPIGRILEDIERASRNMTSEQRQRAMTDLAGAYGIMGLTALTSSIDMETMLNAMDASADAASVARARMNTFEGAIDSLGGSLETLQITVFTPFMNNTLRPLVQQITEVINSFSAWAAANPETAQTIINVVLAIAGLGAGLLALGTIISVAGTAISGIGALLALLSGPIGLVVAGIAALAVAFATNFGGIRDTVQNLLGNLESNFALIRLYAEYYLGQIWERIRPAWETLRDWFSGELMPALQNTFQNHIMPVVEKFTELLGGIWEIVGPHLERLYNWFVNEGLPGILSFITDKVIPQFNNFIDLVGGVWSAISPGLKQFADWVLNSALPSVVEFFNSKVMPIFNAFIVLVSNLWDVISPPLKKMADWFLNSGLPQIVARVEAAIQLIGMLAGALGDPFSTTRTALGGKGAPDKGGGSSTFNKSSVLSSSSTLGGSGTPFNNVGTAFAGRALPMRADGGPVTGGSPYIVGERGPEVFVPGRSGSIVPNGAGMTIQSLTVNWSSSGGEDEFEQFVAKLERLAAGA